MDFHTTIKIDADVLKYSGNIKKAEEISRLFDEREASILSPEDALKQIQEGKMTCISKTGAYKKVYAYVAENAEPLFKTQFYNEDGELIFTYPWNGKVNKYDYKTGRLEFLSSELRRMEHLSSINCFATESGKIMIEASAVMSPFGGVAHSDKEEYVVELYDSDAKEVHFGGSVRKEALPEGLQSAVTEYGFLDRSILFSALAVSDNADESLKKIKENSYVV